MVEDKPAKKHLFLKASAIVEPKNRKVPLWIIISDCEPTTIYKGTKVASAEAISNLEGILYAGKINDSKYTDQEQKKVIDDALSTMPNTFSVHQFTQLVLCSLLARTYLPISLVTLTVQIC